MSAKHPGKQDLQTIIFLLDGTVKDTLQHLANHHEPLALKLNLALSGLCNLIDKLQKIEEKLPWAQ